MNGDGERSAPGLLAFAADDASRRVIRSVSEEMGLADADVKAGKVRDAVKHLHGEPSPRILLVDVDDSDFPISDMSRLAEVCEPATQVVVLGQRADVGVFRELIQMGVVDYLVKPITPDLLRRALGIARQGRDPADVRRRTGKLVAFAGMRGGAGASSLLVNIGVYLAGSVGRRVILVDLDLHTGILDVMLDLPTDHGLRNTLEAPDSITDETLDRAVREAQPGLYVLNSQEPLGEAVAYDADALDTVFDVLARHFHFVLIDVPRSPDPVHQHALAAAQSRVLLADPTVAAARDTLRHLQQLESGEANRTYVVLNRRWTPSGSDVGAQDLARTLGRAVDFEIPYARNAVARSINTAQPIVNDRGAVARVYTEIADALTGRRSGRTGLAGRLRRWFAR